MNDYRILVADSGETSRKRICSLLKKKGYKIYQATDGAGAIRIARTVAPDLVLMDVNLWGIQAVKVARIIEEDYLSTVIFITNNIDKDFYDILKNMNVYAYIIKPIQIEQLYSTIEFSIMNSNKINELTKTVQKLEEDIKGRKKLERAKGLLMDKLGILEKEAYGILRKRSMNECTTIYKIADKIIKQYNK